MKISGDSDLNGEFGGDEIMKICNGGDGDA